MYSFNPLGHYPVYEPY